MSAALLVLATDPAPAPYFAALAFGFVLGTFGHIMRSRYVVALGIIVIGAATALFIAATNPSLGH